MCVASRLKSVRHAFVIVREVPLYFDRFVTALW